MDWYTGVEKQLNRDHDYSHADMIRLLKYAYPDLKENSYQWGLSALLKSGQIAKTGYNEYRVADTDRKPVYVPYYSDLAQELISRIHEKYPLVNFTVMEMTNLNEFLNHLIAQNTVFIHMERELSAFVFRYLQEEGYPNVLYKPTEKEMTMYWKRDTIVILDLVSEAPMNLKKPGVIRAEKLLVDIYCDPAISNSYNVSEYPSILEQMLQKYTIDEPRMLRYARRRNKQKEIKAILSRIKTEG